MKLLSSLRRFSRRKAAIFALAAGLLAAVASWCWLPPTPFFRDTEKRAGDTFSPRFSPRVNFAV